MGSGVTQGQWLVWGPLTSAYYNIFRPTIRSDNNIWYHAGRTNAFALDGLDGVTMNFWTGTFDLMRGPDHWNHSSNPNSPRNEANSRWANPGTLSCTP